jgi:hypothetical protein
MASTPDAQQVRGGGGGGHGGDTIPEGAASPQLANTHQLDFYQAMGDFRVMFPNMDEEIIEAVLRANNGAVDATIDQLLTMNVDTTPAPPTAAFSAAAPTAAAAYQPPEYATVTKKKTPARASNWSAQVSRIILFLGVERFQIVLTCCLISKTCHLISKTMMTMF